MLRFFRQIRQRLLTDNKFSKYLLYAVGEILLVVIGILIALQVDNMNEERIKRERYEFGIKKLYNRLKARDLTWDLYHERAKFHLMVIDSLLNDPAEIAPNRIPAYLLTLDEFLNDDWMDQEWFLDYLDFNPTDSVQFEVAQNLRRYFYGRYPAFKYWATLEDFETFKDLLIDQNLPLCEIGMAKPLRSIIDECAGHPMDSSTLERSKRFILSEKIRSKLQTLQKRRRGILDESHSPERSIMLFIEENFMNLDLTYEYMEVVGDASPRWSELKGIPMEPINEDRTIWQVECCLEDGVIKFRTDENWTFEWGGGELNSEKIFFKGPNIPVKKGCYKILLNLIEKNYRLIPTD